MIKAHLQIIRPLNILISTSCVILTALIYNKLSYQLIPLIIVIACIASFANIINDVFDYEVDKKNKPNRPISSGLIKFKSALILCFLLLVITIIIIFYYDFNAISKILILGINLPLIIFYTPLFKNVPFIGNIIIAFILSMVFIVSAMYLEGDLFQITPPAILAFLLMLIREVVKDVADYEGDKDLKINTFPVAYGINNTIKLILSLVLILILTSFSFTSFYNIIYLYSIIFLVDMPLLYYSIKLFKNPHPNYCKYFEKVLKLLTIFGVIVIYLSII